METSILTDYLLPLSLFIIMLGMGMSLVINDFKHGIHEPEDSRGVHSFAVHDRIPDQREMCAVNESHSIE